MEQWSEWLVSSDDCGDVAWWMVYRYDQNSDAEQIAETFAFTADGKQEAERMAAELNSTI